MADLTGRNADETKPDIATWGTGNVLETGEGVVKVDLDGKASLSGAAIQTKSTMKTDTFSEVSSSNQTGDVTGLTVSITPKHEDSVIEISGFVSLSRDGSDPPFLHLYRDGVEIARGDSASSRSRTHSSAGQMGSNRFIVSLPLSARDVPATTDEITYSVRAGSSVTSETLYVNRSANDNNDNTRQRTISTLRVTEIAQ